MAQDADARAFVRALRSGTSGSEFYVVREPLDDVFSEVDRLLRRHGFVHVFLGPAGQRAVVLATYDEHITRTVQAIRKAEQETTQQLGRKPRDHLANAQAIKDWEDRQEENQKRLLTDVMRELGGGPEDKLQRLGFYLIPTTEIVVTMRR